LEGIRTMWRQLFILVSLIFNVNAHGAEAPLKDEIIFFNVGQGHAALIYKAGHVPLLVDAGSDSRPNTAGEMYEWTKFEEEVLLSQISDKILGYWRNFNHGILQGGQYSLNIIVSHPDEDHKGFIPQILVKLTEAARSQQFEFLSYALLGGTDSPNHYPINFLPNTRVVYSRRMDAMVQNYNFLNSSGCITHFFCPIGRFPQASDSKETVAKYKNGWSVIVRVQVNGISAILTGDADVHVKEQMLANLGANREVIASDILLAPHHGSDVNTFLLGWDQAVNPRAIVIGAAPNRGQKGNRHPRGETIHQLLSVPDARIWANQVMPHGILYNCDQRLHDIIQATHFTQRQRLFDLIPNPAAPTGEGANKWQIAWVDVPLYTLWTTGTLIFSENVDRPQFIDAPNGLMTYVAVPNFKYFLSPEQRIQNPTLVNLVDLFLVGGEGDIEQLTQMVANLTAEGSLDLAREGLILTDGLSLYENRSRMVRTLLGMLTPERSAILELARPLIRPNTKNFSARYRILEAVARMQREGRHPLVKYVRDNFIPLTEDAFEVANTFEVFSGASLEDADDMVRFMQPVFPSFLTLTSRERVSTLKMMQTLLTLERARRRTVFQLAQPFIMPKELSMLADNPQGVFHDVSSNASLITIFSQVLPEGVEEFSHLLHDAWGHLMSSYGPRDLYGENKHFFIRGLLSVLSVERLNFLRIILPALSQVTQKQFECWVAAAITEELAKVYTEPHFALRIEYLLRMETQKNGREDSVFNPESIGYWLKMSVGYTQMKALNL